jgi:DeoR/GlpR family transcriptional regulator of sugar metabolism
VAHEGDAAVKQAMLAASRRKVLVVDHTKLDRHEPYAVAPLAAFDLVITDRDMAVPSGDPEVRVVAAR